MKIEVSIMQDNAEAFVAWLRSLGFRADVVISTVSRVDGTSTDDRQAGAFYKLLSKLYARDLG